MQCRCSFVSCRQNSSQVKSLFFAQWQDVGRAARQQVADFYEVPVETINTNHKRYRDEFDLDGVQILSGQELKEVKFITNLTSSSPRETRSWFRSILEWYECANAVQKLPKEKAGDSQPHHNI